MAKAKRLGAVSNQHLLRELIDLNVLAATTADTVQQMKRSDEAYRLRMESATTQIGEVVRKLNLDMVTVKSDVTDMKPKVEEFHQKSLKAAGARDAAVKVGRMALHVARFLRWLIAAAILAAAWVTAHWHWNGK